MHKHLLASAAGLCEPPTSPAALPPPQSSRILRILRLLKVTRLLRHQLLRRMEDSWGLNHGYVALAKFSAGTLLLAHWMGCALALVRRASALLSTPAADSVDSHVHRLTPPELQIRHIEQPDSLGGYLGMDRNDCNWENAYLNLQHGRTEPCVSIEPELLTTCASPALPSTHR